MKRLAGFVFIFLILFPLTVNAGVLENITGEIMADSSQAFPDVSSDHNNYTAIKWMFNEGIVEGYPDGNFKPENSVNRAELMKMVVLMQPDVEIGGNYIDCFPDVQEEWFAPYVCYALELGWIEGYPDGSFKPENYVNRVEAVKIILNSMMPADQWPEPTEEDFNVVMPSDLNMDEWYGGYMRFAVVKALLDNAHMTENDDGTYNFYPDGDFTRMEVAEMLFRTYVYLTEREKYAAVMTEAICFIVNNSGSLYNEDLNAGVISIFEENSLTKDEMDELTLKYENDNVVQNMIADSSYDLCKATENNVIS